MPSESTFITTLISQLGVGAIFVWIWTRERSDHKETLKKKDDLTDKVLQVFQDNVKATEGLKNSLEGNTKVVDTLTQKIDNIVRHK